MFERFTDRARRVVVMAQEEARRLGHGHIGTEHILLGLVREEDGIAGRALRSFGIAGEQVRNEVEGIIGRGERADTGAIPFASRAKKVLELSLREALDLRHGYIGTEHILLGLIREGEGVAARVLTGQGAQLEAVRTQVIMLLGRRDVRRALASEESLPVTGASVEARLERVQESLDRIERRLAAMAGEDEEDGENEENEENGENGQAGEDGPAPAPDGRRGSATSPLRDP